MDRVQKALRERKLVLNPIKLCDLGESHFFGGVQLLDHV